jgi:hypothetical protein
VRKITTPFGLPTETYEAHDVWSERRELPHYKAISHLVPYIVHGVKLHAFALVPVSEDKKIDQETVNFIMIAFLGVDGVAVDAVEDVIGWEEVMALPQQTLPAM